MYQLVVSATAQEEFEDSLQWYKERSEIVALRFKLALERAFKNIKSSPRSYQNIFEDYYHIHLRKHPFTIIYTVEEVEKTVLIESIFHQKRNPENKYK